MPKKPLSIQSETPFTNVIDVLYDDIIIQEITKFDQHINAIMAEKIEKTFKINRLRSSKTECQDCIDVFDENVKIRDELIAKQNAMNVSSQPCVDTTNIVKVINKVTEFIGEGGSIIQNMHAVLKVLDIDRLYDQTNFENHNGFLPSPNNCTHKEQFLLNIINECLKLKARKIGARISEEEQGSYVRHKNRKSTHQYGQ